jgi:hypothetical protein
VIPDYGGRHETFTVAEIDPPRTLVYLSRRGRTMVSWSITLHPEPLAPAGSGPGSGCACAWRRSATTSTLPMPKSHPPRWELVLTGVAMFWFQLGRSRACPEVLPAAR